ncbi:type III secretion system translocon subunit SctB [Desulfovibrio sp. OttesenSCG-928-F20]|nr:type III secretion system translocon subunit SctB [Desulfovibrio sp. OttesenSCG-928-F20]
MGPQVNNKPVQDFINGLTTEEIEGLQQFFSQLNRQKDDVDGAGKPFSRDVRDIPFPRLGNKIDMMAMMAKFEELIILLTEMAKEMNLSDREAEISALQTKIADLLKAATEKEKGAKDMRTMAIISLVVAVVSAAISFVGAGIQLGGVGKGLKAAGKIKIKDLDSSKQTDVGSCFKTSAKQAAGKGYSKTELINTQSKAFDMGSGKSVKVGMMFDQVGRAGSAVSSYLQTEGQVQNQLHQAAADKIQARAEQSGVEVTKAQQRQQEWTDLLHKLYELLQQFYSAQEKIAGAAQS